MEWLTILHTIPKENLLGLLDYCKQAREHDKTFTFKEQTDSIIISSPNRDQAFRRGVLFHHRFGCYFEVIKESGKDG
jgi:hypothetical protein